MARRNVHRPSSRRLIAQSCDAAPCSSHLVQSRLISSCYVCAHVASCGLYISYDSYYDGIVLLGGLSPVVRTECSWSVDKFTRHQLEAPVEASTNRSSSRPQSPPVNMHVPNGKRHLNQSLSLSLYLSLSLSLSLSLYTYIYICICVFIHIHIYISVVHTDDAHNSTGPRYE